MKHTLMTAIMLSAIASGCAFAASTITPHTYTVKVVNGGMPPSIFDMHPPVDAPVSIKFTPGINALNATKYTWFCSPISCVHSGFYFTTIRPVPYGQAESLSINFQRGPFFSPNLTYISEYYVDYETKISKGDYYSLGFEFSGDGTLPHDSIPFSQTVNTMNGNDVCLSIDPWCE